MWYENMLSDINRLLVYLKNTEDRAVTGKGFVINGYLNSVAEVVNQTYFSAKNKKYLIDEIESMFENPTPYNVTKFKQLVLRSEPFNKERVDILYKLFTKYESIASTVRGSLSDSLDDIEVVELNFDLLRELQDVEVDTYSEQLRRTFFTAYTLLEEYLGIESNCDGTVEMRYYSGRGIDNLESVYVFFDSLKDKTSEEILSSLSILRDILKGDIPHKVIRHNGGVENTLKNLERYAKGEIPYKVLMIKSFYMLNEDSWDQEEIQSNVLEDSEKASEEARQGIGMVFHVFVKDRTRLNFEKLYMEVMKRGYKEEIELVEKIKDKFGKEPFEEEIRELNAYK